MYVPKPADFGGNADVQAFIAALTKYPQQSYVQLLNTIRDELKGKYDQKPQLSASHRESLDIRIDLS
jgi:hypothetical protein